MAAGGGVEANALRVTIASDSTGLVSVDDNGGSLTVDGTVTANLSATDNAVLDTIETNTDFGTVTGGGVEASALRVTLANDSTGVLSVDDNGGSLTVDNADITTLASTVAAEDAALPSNVVVVGVHNDGTNDTDYLHTNTAGALKSSITSTGSAVDSASTGTDVVFPAGAIRDDSLSALTPVEGDFVALRVNSTGALHVTGGGGGTQYNVDDVAGGTDTGTLLLAVRDDSLTTLTPADGDYTQLRVSSTGALHVTGGGGGTEYNEDAATPNPIVGTATLMERDDALSTLTPIEGDFAAFRCNARGALWVEHDTTTPIPVTDNGGSLTVDGTVTANLSATDNAVLDQIEVNTSYGDNTGGGTEAGALRVTLANDSTGVVSVDDNGGSLTVDGTITANLSATDNAVLDDIAAKLAPNTTNGVTPYLNQDTSAIATVKSGAGTVYWITCMSIDATPVYLNLYDSTSAVLGTTTPTNQFIVPTQGDANGAGFTMNFGEKGIQYSTGIQVAAATTFNGSTDPGTNVVITNIGYE